MTAVWQQEQICPHLVSQSQPPCLETKTNPALTTTRRVLIPTCLNSRASSNTPGGSLDREESPLTGQLVPACYRLLQIVTDCYRLLQNVTACYCLLLIVTACYRLLQFTGKWVPLNGHIFWEVELTLKCIHQTGECRLSTVDCRLNIRLSIVNCTVDCLSIRTRKWYTVWYTPERVPLDFALGNSLSKGLYLTVYLESNPTTDSI